MATQILSSETTSEALSPVGRRDDKQARLIQYGLALITVVVVLGPIIPVIYQSFIDRPIYASGHEAVDFHPELSRVFHREVSHL